MTNRISTDKKYHFFCCALIALVASALGSNLAYCFTQDNPTLRYLVAMAIGFAFALLIGLAKEVADSRQKGNHFCLYDLLADLLGSLSTCWLGALVAFAL